MYGRHHMLLAVSGFVALAAHAKESGNPLVPRLDPTLFSHSSVVTLQNPEAEGVRWGLSIALGVLVVAIGSLLPDLDSEHSTLTTRRWFGLGYLFLLASMLLRLFVPHRGPFHSVLIGALITLSTEVAVRAVSHGAVTNVGFLLGAGFLSHLITDAMSASGVALFWPVSFVIRIPPSYRVGSFTETAIAWLGALGLTALSFVK